MEKICLDTEVTIDFLLGEKVIVEKLRNYVVREEICINPITLFYLYRTIRKPEIVSTFAANITVMQLDSQVAAKAAEIEEELREKNMEKSNDIILMAATCMVNGAFLFTKDRKKFDGIRGLKIV
ncbi:MAG: PIN domain-containing protein [Candidatus Micrarchaeota archaeon]|nr:PIN domain-containing protein [Candidatus Micrarchaeota archaeon]